MNKKILIATCGDGPLDYRTKMYAKIHRMLGDTVSVVRIADHKPHEEMKVEIMGIDVSKNLYNPEDYKPGSLKCGYVDNKTGVLIEEAQIDPISTWFGVYPRIESPSDLGGVHYGKSASTALLDLLPARSSPGKTNSLIEISKTHAQDLQANIARRSSKLLKDLNFGIVPKTFSGSNKTPKKKKRKK